MRSERQGDMAANRLPDDGREQETVGIGVAGRALVGKLDDRLQGCKRPRSARQNVFDDIIGRREMLRPPATDLHKVHAMCQEIFQGRIRDGFDARRAIFFMHKRFVGNITPGTKW